MPQTEEEIQKLRQAIFDQCVKWREQREAKAAARIAKRSKTLFDKAARAARKAERAAEFARKFRPGVRKSTRIAQAQRDE